jgi:hypothetical protein
VAVAVAVAVAGTAAARAVAIATEPTTLASADVALAADVGASWAAARREEFERAGRPIEDGWPGTMSEAGVRFGARLARRGPGPRLAATDVAALVRLTYDTARTMWRAWANR